MPGELPLGRQTTYPDAYDPALLHPIARADSRRALGLAPKLPFQGEDVWNAWDLTWLAPHGQPQAASAVIRVPASSTNIIESKSMKLYLNSLSMTPFDDEAALARRLAEDLTRAAGDTVSVTVDPPDARAHVVEKPDGRNLDALRVRCEVYEVDAGLLSTTGTETVEATAYTHAFRSLCPVTGQPDLGSIIVRYRGRAIDDRALLRYLVSYRQHADFHEACAERIFMDVVARCAPERLSVCARFQRRGGIDINPYRTTGRETATNPRLWRQ